MPIHPDLRDVADLLGLSGKEAGRFCSEVAWHVSDRQISYVMIADAIDAHPRIDPSPEQVAAWIMATPVRGDGLVDPADYVDLEYDPSKGKLNVIQRHDRRDALAGLKKCPHGVPIAVRCRICRPND